MSKEKWARNGFGEKYLCLKDWPKDCDVQCGGHGIVLPAGSFEKVMSSDSSANEIKEAIEDPQTYTTAFFEAFPKDPSCFIRGEGKTVEEAEAKAYEKWQGILNCPGHEFEPRGRRDGYGYCKHCTLSKSGVLPCLNKCTICGEPTNYSTDTKGRFYCKRHNRIMPRKLRSSFVSREYRRFPRKEKKALLKGAIKLLEIKGSPYKRLRFEGRFSHRIIIDGDRLIHLDFRKQREHLIKLSKMKIK